jgi:prolyl 4-hydroxylase
MGGYNALATAMRCQDEHMADCARRAKEGECEKEHSNMIGPGGECRLTCKDCIVCPAGDILCGRRNMRGLIRRNGTRE